MQSVYPVLKYDDAHAAIDFLERAFGFERHAIHEGEAGAIVHAELRFGDQVVMVSLDRRRRPGLRPGRGAPPSTSSSTRSTRCTTRAKAAGAEIVMAPTDQDYGSRDFSVRDPEGNIWSVRDLPARAG